jgi:hypothetical protein
MPLLMSFFKMNAFLFWNLLKQLFVAFSSSGLLIPPLVHQKELHFDSVCARKSRFLCFRLSQTSVECGGVIMYEIMLFQLT